MKSFNLYLYLILCIAGQPAAHACKADSVTQSGIHTGIFMQSVQLSEGYLSVNVRHEKLSELVREVARQAELKLFTYADLETRVTFFFSCLPFDQGIRRILAGHSYVLVYSRHDYPSEHRRLWVFSHESGGQELPARTVEDGRFSGSYLSPQNEDAISWNALSSLHADEREEAIIALSDSTDASAITQLSVALNDPSPAVREAAIDGLADIGGEEAVEALAIALHDPESKLRRSVIEALVDIEGDASKSLLRKATADSDSGVREAALEGLEYLAENESP